MKNYLYSTSYEKEINIFIEDNISKKILKKYEDYYSSLIVFESNLRNIFKIKNIKYIRSGKEAKALDKFLDLSNNISKNNITNLICVGGSELLNLGGYTYSSLNFDKNSLIFLPTTLKSMIIPLVRGNFNLNMNFEENYLAVNGYPDFIYIDPILLNRIEKVKIKKDLIYPYFLGIFNNKNYSKLCLNYLNKNENIDFYDFILYGTNYSLSVFSSLGYFPGDKIKYKIFDKNYIFKNDNIDIDAIVFLFILYISFLKNKINLNDFENYLSFIKKAGFEINNIINNIKLEDSSKSFKDVIISNNNYIEILITKQELRNYIDEFIYQIRGEKF